MSKTQFELVGDFHRKFELPAFPGRRLQMIEGRVFDFRFAFLKEELDELLAAQCRQDLPGIADALADLVYVALGTAHYYGIPFDAVFAEVHRANMEKVRAASDDDPRSKRNTKLDVVKPDGWRPPDILKALVREKWTDKI